MGKRRKYAQLLSILMIAMVLFSGMTSAYAAENLAVPETEISIDAASGKPVVEWDDVEGAVKYEIWRSFQKVGSYAKVGTQESAEYTDTTAVPGKTYYYRVRALDADGEKGGFSAPRYITCDCARPVVTSAPSVYSGKPRLTWKAVEGASKYEVYRASSKDGSYTRIYTTQNKSFTNTSVAEGQTFYYKVKAICGASSYGDSALSAAESGSCGNVTITLKLGLDEQTGKPVATWNSIEGAAKYEVWRASSKNGTYSKKYTLKSTKYTNTAADAGYTYYYKVRAVDADGNYGKFSTAKYITCDCARPVVTVAPSVYSGKPQLKWEAVKGASKYEVYRAVGEDGAFSRIYTTEKTSFTNTGAEEGKTYSYKVRAVCGKSSYGNSAYSEAVSIQCGSAEVEKDEVIGTAVCTANEWMNLRSGPGTSYAKSGTMNAGEKADVYEEKDGWYKIKLDGAFHWASGDYLSVTMKGEPDADGKYDGFPIAKNTKLKGKVVILDPGHGTGAGGAFGDYAEHVYNLKHAKLVKQSLENSGATVIMTRTTDTNVDNYARVSMANKYTLEVLKENKESEHDKLSGSGLASDDKLDALQEEIDELERLIGVMQSVINNPKLADTYYLSPYDAALGRPIHKDLKKIFELQKNSLLDHIIYVSIHSNATGDGSTSANGTVTFYMDNEYNKAYYTGYQATKNKKLATEICNEVVAAGGYAKRGVKVNDYFMVREVNIPSALLEVGFHTHAGDREKLMDTNVQKRVANAVTYAIMDYFG